MPSSFRRLAAYDAAVRLADELHPIVSRWQPLDQWSLGIQLLKAADSVGANIAEGAGRTNAPDRRRFFMIARGSLRETEHWLARAAARGLLESDYATELEEILRPLSGLIRRPTPK
jgi:four helix bundle protein